MSLDFRSLGDAILDAAAQALGSGAEVVATRARQLAPVRRIFSDGGQAIRFKSISEIEGARTVRDLAFKAGGPPTVIEPESPRYARTVTGRRPPRHWKDRRLQRAQQLLADYDREMSRRRAGMRPRATFLTRRGAHEVRSKRAAFSSWGHLHIGGRLRGEIHATPVSVTGDRAEAWVISPTPYAKYQEFGTRHNAAHPFLRPAAEGSREAVVGLIANAVAQASRTGAGTTEIEIVVRL